MANMFICLAVHLYGTAYGTSRLSARLKRTGGTRAWWDAVRDPGHTQIIQAIKRCVGSGQYNYPIGPYFILM